MEGNCDMGSVLMASMPKNTMNSDITMDSTGLSINLLNIFLLFFALDYSEYSSK